MLKDIKALLGIEDDSMDTVLNSIINNTISRLKVLIGGIEPPETLGYIITEVSIKRFNRIGSEGLSSHTVEGENMAFTDNDFEEFAEDIQAFLDAQKETTRGKVRFL